VLQAAQREFAGACVDQRDGLHLAWDDGWLHVRASNTEPILRVIAEATTEQAAKTRVARIKALAKGTG
jgi:phosphomannomutase